MFAPTKTWRRWHRKINTNQKRYAVASALAASALTPLVQGRGHLIDQVQEIPLVVDAAIEKLKKTKEAIAALKHLGAYADVEKALITRKIRRGRGKMRNRRHVLRRGPLIVYNEDQGIVKAFRNLPGVDTAQVDALNLLQLAPGGHLGRFIIWTHGAFDKLNQIWGSHKRESTLKDYVLPRSVMSNSDVTRLINSDEVQSHVRAPIKTLKRRVQHKNPLKNFGARVKLNPFALTQRRAELVAAARRAAGKKSVVEAARARYALERKEHDRQQKINYKRLTTDNFEPPPKPKSEEKKAAAKKGSTKGGAKPARKESGAAETKPAAKGGAKPARKESGAAPAARKESAADKPARKESAADKPARKESGADAAAAPAAKKGGKKK